MSWKIEADQPKLERFKAIRCLTCDKDVPSKKHLKAHMNHDVRYVNESGEIE